MDDKLTAAPEGTRCEAGITPMSPEGTCGAGQPLYVSNGLVHCDHHRAWPASKEGRTLVAVREATKKVGG